MIVKRHQTTNLKGFKKLFWKKDLKGYFSIGDRELTDAEIRHLLNYAVTKGYERDVDIPAYEISVLLGMEPKFKIRALHDNGSIKKGQVFDAEYRERGSSYKHKENIMVWSSDSKIAEDGHRYGSYAYMDDSIFGNDEVMPIFEIVNPENDNETENDGDN